MLSLGDLILGSLEQFLWIVFIQGPLCLLSIASIALQFLTGGMQWVIFFNAPVQMIDGVVQPPTWEQISIPWPFIGFLAVAFCVRSSNFYS